MAPLPDTLTRRQVALLGLGPLSVPSAASGNQRVRVASTRETNPRALAGIETLDVRDFGAKGDGVTDDAIAINSMVRSLRERHASFQKLSFSCRLVLPTGVYAVESSLDFTNLEFVNLVIDGQGSVILGRCPGQAVIDAFGSRWLTVRDLTIFGEKDSLPKIGMQIGRTHARSVADDHRLDNIKIIGHFSLACLYNRAAETSQFDHLALWNDASDSYCLVQDGTNNFGVISEFTNVDIKEHGSLSFNENLFLNCDFRHGAGGTPVWLGDTARHSFTRCYSATTGEFSFEIFSGTNGHSLLELDCHCERQGLKTVCLFSSRSPDVVVRGLLFRDHFCFASDNILAHNVELRSIKIECMRIEIAAFKFGSCRVFDPRGTWEASGNYYGPDAKSWNGSNFFHGTALLGLRVEQT